MSDRTTYECTQCGHRIVLLEDDVRPVYCRCTPRGPVMKPVSDGGSE
jgi:DNA-directed RNA polymerase subunit RPC12/RpoP